MRKKYILKLVIVMVAAFCMWVYFWDKPAPEKTVVVDVKNDILQN